MNEQLYELVYGILQDHSPTDCEAFAAVGRQMISSRLESRTGVRTGDPKEFGFVRPVDCILMYAPGTKRKHD